MIKIQTANIADVKGLMTLKYTSCDIFMLNYYKEIYFATYYEIPEPYKIVREISYKTESVVTICSKVNIEDDKFFSVAVFEKGLLLGVSDMISDNDGYYVHGKCQKIFKTSCGNFGVCVGTDFLFPQTENCICGGADFLLHHTLDKLGCEYICAGKGHTAFGTKYVGLYNDTLVKSDGRAECVDVGQETQFRVEGRAMHPPLAFLKLSRIE